MRAYRLIISCARGAFDRRRGARERGLAPALIRSALGLITPQSPANQGHGAFAIFRRADESNVDDKKHRVSSSPRADDGRRRPRVLRSCRAVMPAVGELSSPLARSRFRACLASIIGAACDCGFASMRDVFSAPTAVCDIFLSRRYTCCARLWERRPLRRTPASAASTPRALPPSCPGRDTRTSASLAVYSPPLAVPRCADAKRALPQRGYAASYGSVDAKIQIW